MPRVGVTGHVELPFGSQEWVLHQLVHRLETVVATGWEGVTCLARGADQLFAAAMVRLQGRYDVILPAQDYAQRMIDDGHGEQFGRLLALAEDFVTLPYPTSSRAAYLAASEAMLNRCDLLLAVWDGRPSRAVGDTADIVAKARTRGIPVEVLWPLGPRSEPPPDANDALVTPVAAPGPR
jgi:hypothetical protein